MRTFAFTQAGKHPWCRCDACEAAHLEHPEPEDPPRKLLGAGVFGPRMPQERSRFREHLAPDLYLGRRAGGHPAPAMRRMPLPPAAERARAERLAAEVLEACSRSRVPLRRLGTRAEYRAELASEALAILCERAATVEQAVVSAEKRLRKLYRETSMKALSWIE